jgi:hypothetical protein
MTQPIKGVNLRAVHQYRQKHPDRIRKYKKDYAKRNPDTIRELGRRSRLVRALKLAGITKEEYEMALERSGGVCEVCGNLPKRTRLSVEHSHKTGKFRGLVCERCNRILGFSEDSSTLLYKLGNYLLERGL